MNTLLKITSFTDLNAWKEAHVLVLMVYETTNMFPQAELFKLTSQMCRASVSITSNIAEGFSRNSAKEKNYFYAISLGSLTETENQLIIARDLKYIPLEKFKILANQIVITNKLLHGLMKSAQNRRF